MRRQRNRETQEVRGQGKKCNSKGGSTRKSGKGIRDKQGKGQVERRVEKHDSEGILTGRRVSQKDSGQARK